MGSRSFAPEGKVGEVLCGSYVLSVCFTCLRLALSFRRLPRAVLQMYAVGEGHEREESPIIVDSRIVSILNTEPAFYLWTSDYFS